MVCQPNNYVCGLCLTSAASAFAQEGYRGIKISDFGSGGYLEPVCDRVLDQAVGQWAVLYFYLCMKSGGNRRGLLEKPSSSGTTPSSTKRYERSVVHIDTVSGSGMNCRERSSNLSYRAYKIVPVPSAFHTFFKNRSTLDLRMTSLAHILLQCDC